MDGRIRRAWTAGAQRLSETSHAPGRLRPHCHSSASLCLVLRGELHESSSSGTFSCAPSAAVFRPAGLEHEDLFGAAGGFCFNVEIPADLLEGEVAPVIDSGGGPLSWRAFALLEQLRAEEPDELLIDSLVGEVAALARAREKPSTQCARRALGLLRERFREVASLRALARELGVHPVHLARSFRSAYGTSVGAHTRQLRVQHALREIARSGKPLSEIAFEAGFADQAHLTRTLRHFAGRTPGRVRQLLNA